MRITLTYCETEHPVQCNWMVTPNEYPVCTEEFDVPEIDGEIHLRDGGCFMDDVYIESPNGRFKDTVTGKRYDVCIGYPETMKIVEVH